MPISVLTNVASAGAQRTLQNAQGQLGGNVARLSSGQRINSAGDDAAGLSVSDQLRSEVRSLASASRNAAAGASLVQTLEGGLSGVTASLQRLRELAVRAATNPTADTRDTTGEEARGLLAELDRINSTTTFEGRPVFGAAEPFDLQVGASTEDMVRLDTRGMRVGAAALGLDTITLAGAPAEAQDAIGRIDTAVARVTRFRADVGAAEFTVNGAAARLRSNVEGLAGAGGSRIRDVDVAEETAALARNQILSQAGLAVLAQANQLPSTSLSLLR